VSYRIIAVDMDGTLLDAHGTIPAAFRDVMAHAEDTDVVIAPASGRQLRTLQDIFEDFSDAVPEAYIAENGTVVSYQGEIVSTTALPADPVHAIIDAAAEDFVVVVCRPDAAYIPAGLSAPMLAEIAKYYHSTVETADLHDAVTEDVVKVAVYTPGVAEAEVFPVVDAAAPDVNVVVSGVNWVDVMHPEADKGVALLSLADALGVAHAETVAFGDYLNDYALLQAAGTAWAMDNAHPELKAIADHIAPSNVDHGVVTVLKEHFGLH
jgi:Cof subfamily protein (haloacid dehalogenase superfamily)